MTSSWPARLTVAAHAALAVWLLINGVAHQIGVLWGAWRGTLRRPDELEAMLAVGAGLLVAGALASWSLPALTRGATGPAWSSVAVLAAIVLLIAGRFGWTFLGGTTLLGAIDVLALLLLASHGVRHA